MYGVNLTTSHFPAQNNAESRDITVGGLLREVAATHPDALAMVDVAESGNCGKSWTYCELLVQAERLAKALVTLRRVNGSSSGHPISTSGCSWSMPAVWRD